MLVPSKLNEGRYLTYLASFNCQIGSCEPDKLKYLLAFFPLNNCEDFFFLSLFSVTTFFIMAFVLEISVLTSQCTCLVSLYMISRRNVLSNIIDNTGTTYALWHSMGEYLRWYHVFWGWVEKVYVNMGCLKCCLNIPYK